MNSDAVYTQTDEVSLQFYPRETAPGSGEYKLFEYYISDRLQAFLKIDFYKAIGYGYHVRRCAYCGRYFLSKRNYHTKYCDNPSPDDPNLTCVQLGYHYLKKKERADDNPKTQSLRRCDQRIIKDCSRGVITKDEEERLREKARKLYYAAATSPGTSNEEFEEMLRSENLYPLCGVRKKTNRRGRPKKM